MTRETVNELWMELQRWTHESCVADFSVGDGWATLYRIESTKPGRGHATKLLTAAKRYYEEQGKKVGGTVALNEKMMSLYQRVGIREYTEVADADK